MLISSGVRQGGGVYHKFGAPTPSVVERANWGQHGTLRNLYAGYATIVSGTSVANKSGYPSGVRHPISWLLATKGGGMASYRRAKITINASGSGALGRGIIGSSQLQILANGIGGLIAGGVGSAVITVSGNGSIVATLGAVGIALLSISASADMGALGWLDGDSTITVDGTMTSYGIGHMVGTTEDSGLSVAGIVNGVWNALADENNDPGSMGELLNNSGAGANPWTTEIENSVTALQAMKLILASLAGKVSGAETTTITFRNAVADDKDRIIAVVDENGNRTSITYDVS